MIEVWRRHYDVARSNSSLDYVTPLEFSQQHRTQPQIPNRATSQKSMSARPSVMSSPHRNAFEPSCVLRHRLRLGHPNKRSVPRPRIMEQAVTGRLNGVVN